MELLESKNRPGFFVYTDISRKMKAYVKYDYYPTFEDFWNYETSMIPYNHPLHNVHRQPGIKKETMTRIYNPTMGEALLFKYIKNSNNFIPIEVTAKEDQLGKIDLKAKHKYSNDEIIIQVKSSRPNFKYLKKELISQERWFKKTAEYVVPIFHEDFLPYCEFEYVKQSGEAKIYKMDEADIMLSDMLEEQLRKAGKENDDCRQNI